MTDLSAEQLAESLSDVAIKLCLGEMTLPSGSGLPKAIRERDSWTCPAIKAGRPTGIPPIIDGPLIAVFPNLMIIIP